MYNYQWTDEYGIFRLSTESGQLLDVRPVFREELEYFELDKIWKLPPDDGSGRPILWAEGIRRYMLNNECIAEAVGGGFYTKPRIKVNNENIQLQYVDVDRLWIENEHLMTGLIQRAVYFIRNTYDQYSSQGYQFVSAFSGGKDSLVLLDLMSKSLAPSEFIVVFSNTGMELSDTIKTVETVKERYRSLRFYETKSHLTPYESWREFGPPGRRMRWCCSVLKSVPTIMGLRDITGNYNVKAVVFDGVRADESEQRSKYDEISEGAKNINQINASPILKWNTAELYCYLLHDNLILNHAYKLGLFRVGCMVCPMSSGWWDGIANDYYSNEMKPLLEAVESYAKATKPDKEVKKYIETGGWKGRMGGRGLPNGGNRVTESIHEKAITFSFTEAKQNWNEVCKILGTVVDTVGKKKTQIIDRKTYTYYQSTDEVPSITYEPITRIDRLLLSKLRGIANKVAYCIGCKTCMVQCPTGAFIINEHGEIQIRENLCIHCYNCLTYTTKGCLVAKSLATTQGGTGMDLKGMNRYQHFGLREPWLELFMEHKIDCFGMRTLGTRQYDSLKAWLKDAGMIEVDKSTKTMIMTDLGNKLCELGPYSLITWAVVWSNLCYNSIICKWFCLNIEIGGVFNKSLLVDMLNDDYTVSTRDNAVTSLLEIFRHSPQIGSVLMQGLPLSDKANTNYMRSGWETPDAIVLLYTLYLFAEKTGYYNFTLSRMISCHNNPEGKGMSPHDIFGIETGALKEMIQGLALNDLTRPFISVSFVADLDNIMLTEKINGKEVSSLNILELITNE